MAFPLSRQSKSYLIARSILIALFIASLTSILKCYLREQPFVIRDAALDIVFDWLWLAAIFTPWHKIVPVKKRGFKLDKRAP